MGGGEFGERIQRGSDENFDDVGEVGAGDVGAGDGRVFFFGFEGDDAAAGGEAAGEEDGGVAAEGADFEDIFGALEAGEEHQQFALIGGDVDGGEVGIGAGL